MEAREKFILDELLALNKKQFVIPVFQRNYVWGEKDCKKLFDDIIRLQLSSKPTEKHFLGAFVYKFNQFIDQQSVIQNIIIDGQQRLTSITLVIKAFIDYLEKEHEKYSELITELSETYLVNKFIKKDHLRLKLKPNKLDGKNFEYLMHNDFNKIDKTSNIYQNYKLFYELIKNSMNDPYEFHSALRKLQGVSVTLEPEDNPQLIFESLNSTGIDLTDIDLIRNYLLMSARAEEQDEFYEKYWLPMEELLNNSFVNFVRDWLTLENGIVTQNSKHKVYDAFKAYYQSESMQVEKFLEKMLEYAKIYSNLIKPNHSNKEVNEKLTSYIRLDMSTTYPFLFGILKYNLSKNDKSISDENLIEVLNVLEAYVIRRNVCNLAGGGLSIHMASMINNLLEEYRDDFFAYTNKIVSSYLMSIKSKAYFPKDDEFVREFSYRDMYNSRNKKYILEKLENYKQVKEKLFFDNINIEHVMPNTISEKWAKYLKISKNNEDYHIYKNRIGNLTLTAYNSEMSNTLFKEKKKYILNSKLYLNEYFKNIEDWDFDAIEKRSSHLAKIALDIWPLPANKDLVINSKIQTFLMDDDGFDYTGTKPSGISIKDYKIFANNWTSLYVDTLRYLYTTKKELFRGILETSEDSNSMKKVFTDKSDRCRSAEKISDSLYVEVNNNTEVKISVLKSFFTTMKYNIDDIIIFLNGDES